MANKLVKGFGWTTSSSLVRNIVSLLQITILTRILAKSDFGTIAIANLFVSFTSMFLDMGISVGIMYRQDTTKNEYSSLFWLNIFTGIFLTSILFLLTPVLTKAYDSEDLNNVIRLLCFTIFVNSLGAQQRTVCQKRFLFKRLALIEIISSVITFSVAWITARKGYGVYSLAYSTLAGSVFNNFAHLTIGLIKDNRIGFHFKLKETFPFLKIGVYSIGSHVLDFFSRELDIIVVSATLGLEFLGVYSIAKKIPTVIYGFFNPIVSKVITPFLAEINQNIGKVKENYLLITKGISWFAFPVYFLIAAAAPTEMQVVFGNEYVEGALVLSVFAIQYAFNSINTICGSLQTALGRTDIGLYWTIYRIASTAVIYFVTAQFGITVFMLGILGHVFLNVVICWRMQFYNMVKVTFREYISSFGISFVLAGVLCLIMGVLHYAPSLLYVVLCGVAVVAIFIFILLKTSEKEHIILFLQKTGIKVPKVFNSALQ